MTLKEYLKSNDIKPIEFSKLIGLKGRGSISRYLSGTRKPREPFMRRITEATNGEVTANDFYSQPTEAAQ